MTSFFLQILDKRHSQELKDLERMFHEERRVAVDEALAKMEDRHAQENDELRAQHEQELKELDKQKLSAEDLQQKRAQLLNQQQLRQSALDKKHADERKQIQHGVVSDWEVRFARAKLELKEKHYQVGETNNLPFQKRNGSKRSFIFLLYHQPFLFFVPFIAEHFFSLSPPPPSVLAHSSVFFVSVRNTQTP